MKLRLLPFILILFFYSALCGQDTTRLKMVEIIERYDPSLLDHNTHTIDSLTLSKYKTNSVSDLLRENTPVLIKSYGNGGLNTISVRGTSSVHSAVLWNGVPVNLQSTGDVDLSLFNPTSFENISLILGGESSVYGSGSIGGNLLLEDKPLFGQNLNGSLNTSYGSYGKSFYSLNCKVGKDKWSFKINGLLKNDRNEFPFLNPLVPDTSEQIMRYAAVSGKAMNTAVYYRHKRNLFSYHSWLEDYQRDIPASVYSSNPYAAHQTDRNFRNLIQYKFISEDMNLTVKAASISGKLGYSDTVTHVLSNSRLHTFFPEVSAVKKLWKGHAVVGSNATLSSAKNLNYSERKTYNMVGVFGGYSFNINKLHLGANIRQDFVGTNNKAFTFNSSASREIFRNYTLRISGGRSFRAPSMNDLYWVPGGNPDLKPERGWFTEGGLNYRKVFTNQTFSVNTTVYTNYIENWIIWLPQTQTIWTPRNLKNVQSKGVEVFIRDQFSIGRIRTTLNLSYSYTEAVNRSSEEANIVLNDQLIYIPYYLANGSIDLTYKNLSVRFNSSFTGGRYVTSDHTAALPSFTLSNIRVNYLFRYKKQQAEIFFETRNIADKRYQILENRPMPGRTFETGLSINLTK